MTTDGRSEAPRPTQDYEVVSLAARPDLRDRHLEIGGAAWPEFMLHDPVALKYWERLLDCFADYQLLLMAGDEVLAIVDAAPLRFDGALQDLPGRGVDWGVEKSIADHDKEIAPNALMGIQIVVNQAHRGKGLSAISAAEMIELAARGGIGRVILPLRPSHKHKFPLIPMERYIAWKNDRGLPYDGWLRVHLRLGGEIVGLCPESMMIPGTVGDWSRWTGLAFPGSGRYLVPGALVPVEIDLDRDQGIYREPNIWVVHEVAS